MTATHLVTELEQHINKNKLYHYSKLLNREYKIGLTDHQIWRLVLTIFGNEYRNIFIKYMDSLVANDFVNSLVMKYYPGEKIVKYNFVKKLINNNKEVTLFEMYADRSRVDLCRINGRSIAYEIKTEIDSLNRLSKQVEDYSRIFEYVYVITEKKHYENVKEIVPQHVGIITYRLNLGQCTFSYKKRAQKSPFLSAEAQVRNLSSQDMMQILKKQKAPKIPSSKSERSELLIKNYKKEHINLFFKQVIKQKYFNQWKFIKEHFDDIYPIDIQSFFHSPIDPKLAYYKNYSNKSDSV